jgi:hypothetical protein
VQVVEVGRVRWAGVAEIGHGQPAGDGPRGGTGMGEPRVAGGVVIVVGADDDWRAAPPVAHGAGQGFEVAGVEGDGHRLVGGVVQAGSGGEAFGDEDG